MIFKNNLCFYSIITFFIVYLIFPLHCFSSEIDYSDNPNLNNLEVSVPATNPPTLNSRAAIVLEKSTGTILFGKNENDIRKMASTTNIMTS